MLTKVSLFRVTAAAALGTALLLGLVLGFLAGHSVPVGEWEYREREVPYLPAIGNPVEMRRQLVRIRRRDGLTEVLDVRRGWIAAPGQ